ncbi:MAG: NADH:flavin oxidoreductase [Planctomycetes bacterium]|nr:NADH:flavin oxidoreductase [Planctomycetota bacterium]
MYINKNILFSPLIMKNITLLNRFIRSATYEGLGDKNGNPKKELCELYSDLARNNVGTIITGFCYISRNGRAMHPAQCGIDTDNKIKHWSDIVSQVKKSYPMIKLFMQIAHTGRQTLRCVTKQEVVGASRKKCAYFKQKVRPLSNQEIISIISDFANAALRAKYAGFDGVQIHAAHGYLIHQFLSPHTNSRKDIWSENSLILLKILESIKNKCGEIFPTIVKLSHSDDRGMTLNQTINTIKEIEHLLDAVEISFGTMEYALNIIRGACPVETIFNVNPMFKKVPIIFRRIWEKLFMKKYLSKIISFEPNYNLKAAIQIRKQVNVPIITVGGIRDVISMVDIIEENKIDAVSLCRPFICEPDLVSKIKQNKWRKSRCINCNLCTIYCDSNNSLKCYNNAKRIK